MNQAQDRGVPPSEAPLCGEHDGQTKAQRASLLTGRYQTRSGIYPGVLYPGSSGGLPLNETTIAEVLKPLGYATAAMEKWHLGVGANGKFLPTKQGFDQYLGIPYSHDMGPCQNLTCFPPDVKCFGLCDVGTVTAPLMHNGVIKQQPVDFINLERAYRDFATSFIAVSAKKKQPFFLYYPSHHMTTLEKTGVINNTLVFFTSDNGPELMCMSRGGNSGPLKCGKGTKYEGGMREPAVAYWPGTIMPGGTHQMASTLDVLPTIASLAVAKFQILVNQGATHSDTTQDQDCSVFTALKAHDPPLIFDLEADPSECYSLPLMGNPDLQAMLERIMEVKGQFEASMVFGESQISKGSDPNLEPCCNPQCSPKPSCCKC